MSDIERILAESRMNLQRGRAVATGIGVFAVVIDGKGNPLLRRRLETDSLYGQDLSGKWEMTGGGVELAHFTPGDSRYRKAILEALAQELYEEAGLRLVDIPDPLSLIPAWFCRDYERDGERRTSIDLAFSLPLLFVEGRFLRVTDEFYAKIKAGELMFVPWEKLGEIEIVSPRTRFLITEALRVQGTSM